MPPMCIAKGKTKKCLQSFSCLDAPAGTIWSYQEKAWMCDILGEEWFKGVFLKNCGQERPQLLILDSHGSHEVVGLLEQAKKENIHILALPPHTTHYLQPLDRSVFGPFNKAYNRVCTEFLAENPDLLVNKATWPRLFRMAWEAAFTPNNIITGFKSCGLFPVNASAIPEDAYMPSTVYDKPAETITTASVANTVPSSPVPQAVIPDITSPVCTSVPGVLSPALLTVVSGVASPLPTSFSSIPSHVLPCVPGVTSPVSTSVSNSPSPALPCVVPGMTSPHMSSAITGIARPVQSPDEYGPVHNALVPSTESSEAEVSQGDSIVLIDLIAENFEADTSSVVVGEDVSLASVAMSPISSSESSTLLDCHSNATQKELDVSSILVDLARGASVLEEKDPNLSGDNIWSASWNVELDLIFSTPVSDVKSKKKSKAALTSHRLLTSDEVLQEKRDALVLKEQKAAEKENRKRKRANKCK